MNTRMIALSALAILLVVAIGTAALFILQDDDDGNPTAISPDNPQQYLLTLNDMPTGWAILPDEPDSDDEEDDGTTTFLCEERRTGSIAAAERSLQKSATGPYIQNNVSIWEDVDAARRTFAEMKAIADRCDTWADDDGEDITLTPISAPAYGDESFAFRITVGPGEGNSIILRQANALLIIVVLDLPLLGEPAPDGFLDNITQIAVAKFD